MSQDTPNRFLDTRAAAVYLAISSSLLEKRRCSGDGPRYSKLGRSVRYDRRDLDRWADARQRVSTSDPGADPADADVVDG